MCELNGPIKSSPLNSSQSEPSNDLKGTQFAASRLPRVTLLIVPVVIIAAMELLLLY